MDKELLFELKNKSEIIADQHDGSYELMRAIVNEYRDVDVSMLDYLDLNAVYLMSVGTWKHSLPNKKRVIERSHLTEESKKLLKDLLDEIQANSINHVYKHHETSDEGVFGMFGTGFYSFEKMTDNKSVRQFIQMCVDISEMTDDEEIYERAAQVLKKGFKGMRAASASMVLHCLKPYTFPILNSNMGSEDIFAALGIELRKKKDIETYIDNCRAIKTFRDENLPFKNYRIIDMAAWDLGKNLITDTIDRYKADFAKRDEEERYKWEAVKCFQDNWNIHADDFAGMLGKALAKTYNLLQSISVHSRSMIMYFAEKDPARVREMFETLYDEEMDLVERIETFSTEAAELLEKHKDPGKKQHHQGARAVSVYLFMKYPEKYYIYQYQKYKSFAEKIQYEEAIKRGDNQNIVGYFTMCDLVLAEVMKDQELQIMSQNRLAENCYADPQFHLLADDIVYFGSQTKIEDYDDDEKENDKEVKSMAAISQNMILYGPPGTGKTYQTVNYAVAIIEDKPLSLIKAEDYTAVLKRYNKYKDEGYIEFITFHQSFGYEEFIEGIKPVLYSEEDELEGDIISYTVTDGVFKAFCEKAAAPVIKKKDSGFTENSTVWKVSLAGTGDNPIRKDCMEKGYIRIGWDEYGPEIKEDMDYKYGGKNVLNAFINKMQIGDIVFSCFSDKTIDAIGVIEGDYEWREDLEDYMRLRAVKWLVKGIKYNILDLNQKRVMTLSTVYKLKISVADVIKILEETTGAIQISEDNPHKYIFIIDEINRGNISKIFGELITLIETTRRLKQPEELKVPLPYSHDKFGVPNNVFIIGTMNTADRSIALIDTALRRRFKFVECLPEMETLEGIEVEGVSIKDLLHIMNRRIEVLCDREHVIGHSYFLPLKSNPSIEVLADIFAYNIIPLLQEYFYEDYEKIRLVLGDSNKSQEEQFIWEKPNDYGELFGGADFDFDEIVSYEINPAALNNIDAYKRIK